MTRTQLTGVEWEFIEPYLPIGEYGPYPVRLRRQFEGVMWRFRRIPGGRWPAAARGVGIVRHQRGVGPRAQARAAASRVKAATMTATRT